MGSRSPALPILLALVFICSGLVASVGVAVDFVTFETGPVRPLALSADGARLFAVNTPDNQLQIFDVTDVGLILTATVQVGMEPCAVAVAPDGKVWVVNHLSDSVSIVDVDAPTPHVTKTLIVGDAPRDIVFAGTVLDRAFITTAHRGQHREDPSISSVPGAGGPQFSSEGIGRADVWVFNVGNTGSSFGGNPVRILSFFADTPRALAVSSDKSQIFVAAFHSGNQTTVVQELLACDGFNQGVSCLDPLVGLLQLPGGAPGPSNNIFGANAPEVGLLLKYDNVDDRWEDSIGTNWDSLIMFDLPDHDVFRMNADSMMVNAGLKFDHVGTILFNMAVNPVSGKVYVSNTDLPNLTNFEGPGNHGGSTVQGHLSESRISILDPGGAVDVRHLNSHIEYDELHTDDPDNVDETDKDHSLATPLNMAVSGDGATLYVAAYGSAKIGVFSTAALEAGTFDPTVTSADYISTSGGPSGLILDKDRNRLYVATRFDNSVSVIELGTKSTLQSVALHNPEPPEVVVGRPFLYDALNTSGNGEASCSSCHIFGDKDDIAWNLGNPDDAVSNNNQPGPPGVNTSTVSTFHPMKGPMTTQTLRGLSTHGAMHWRGDRLDGFFGEDDCEEPSGAPCVEEHSFKNFIVAFEGLVGKDGVLDQADMQTFTDFALELTLPPNPVRPLNNSLTPPQQDGLTAFNSNNMDGNASCEDCHRHSPIGGFFGSGGHQTFEGLSQNLKVPHLRDAYTKVGMFGMFIYPNNLVQNPNLGEIGVHLGDQVRGFGYLHDGAVDTVESFVGATLFSASPAEEQDLAELVLAFDADIAPIVGQQVTLDSGNSGAVTARIDLMLDQADDPFDSLTLGGSVTECDVIVKGTVGGIPRGWLYRPGTLDYMDDTGAVISDAALRGLAVSEGPLTFTAVPPGSGTRMGINRDRDTLLDGNDNCTGASNDSQTDTDGDLAGDACDQDDDGDALLDTYETDTGTYVSIFDTGTDPLVEDTDGDGYDDGLEVLAGTDPNDPFSNPGGGLGVPLLWGWWPLGMGLALVASAALVSRRRRVAP